MSTLHTTLPTIGLRYIRTRPVTRVASVAWFELCFGWFALVIYGGAIIFPIRLLRGGGVQLPGESDPVMAASQTIIMAVLAFALVARFRRILPLLRFMTPYLLLLLICLVSALWSDHPGATVRRSTTLGVCVMFGVYCFDAFGPTRLIGMLLRVSITLGLLSIVVFLAVPSIGHETAVTYTGAMRGVFSQKNGLAECMLLAISCSAYRFLEEKKTIEFCCAVPLLLGCILLSASATSFMVASAVLAGTVLLFLRPWRRIRAVYLYGLLSTLLILAVCLCFAPDMMLNLIGRDTSLTGRLPLWQGVIGIIAERPFFGHGYSGFWEASSADVQDLWKAVGWDAPDAHNGYLDIMVQLGVFGALFVMLIWSRIIMIALRARHARTLPIATWILLFMLLNMLVNLDEGPLPWADNFTVVMPTIMITVGLWQQRYQRDSLQLSRRGTLASLDLARFIRPGANAELTGLRQPRVDGDGIAMPKAPENGV